MSLLSRLFSRKKYGTKVGNFVRNFISRSTYGLSDAVGLTDGHLNGGMSSNGADSPNSNTE